VLPESYRNYQGKDYEMARNPVSVFKRPTKTKGKFRYYVKLWDECSGSYSTPRSVQSLIISLGLDEKLFSPKSRTGAYLIGQELLRRGGSLPQSSDVLFADYCAQIWDWDTSPYIKSKLARGQRIGKEHTTHSAAYVKNYIRPAFPSLKISALKVSHLDTFILSLKGMKTISNRSINAIIDAMRTPLNEAVRQGLIRSNPADKLIRMGNDTCAKGIPTEVEVSCLLHLPNIDQRIRVAILLGVSCGLRIGEIQALRFKDIGDSAILIAQSWGKMDGLKGTKTGNVRSIPLLPEVRDELLKLANISPYGVDGFLMYGGSASAPLNVRAIERGFDKALVQLSLGEQFAKATLQEKQNTLLGWKKRNITFHSLRHWFNAMLRGSITTEKLKLFTGHSTDEMSEHYDHATETDVIELTAVIKNRILPFIYEDKVSTAS
jgi:integrase